MSVYDFLWMFINFYGVITFLVGKWDVPSPLCPWGLKYFKRKMFGDGNHHSVVSNEEIDTHDVWIPIAKKITGMIQTSWAYVSRLEMKMWNII